MKAKEVLFLVENNKISVDEFYDLVLSYFTKKFKSIGASSTDFTIYGVTYRALKLKYSVTTEFSGSLKKNLRIYARRLVQFLGFHKNTIEDWNHANTQVIFTIPIYVDGVNIFRVEIWSRKALNEVLVSVVLCRDIFGIINVNSVDLKKIYATIDLLVRALRLILPE